MFFEYTLLLCFCSSADGIGVERLIVDCLLLISFALCPCLRFLVLPSASSRSRCLHRHRPFHSCSLASSSALSLTGPQIYIFVNCCKTYSAVDRFTVLSLTADCHLCFVLVCFVLVCVSPSGTTRSSSLASSLLQSEDVKGRCLHQHFKLPGCIWAPPLTFTLTNPLRTVVLWLVAIWSCCE